MIECFYSFLLNELNPIYSENSTEKLGGLGSLIKCAEIAISFNDDDFVYMVEDDYLHDSKNFHRVFDFLEFSKQFNFPWFIHPSDYPDQYREDRTRRGYLFLNPNEMKGKIRKNSKNSIFSNEEENDNKNQKESMVMKNNQNYNSEKNNITKKQKEDIINRKKIRLEKFMKEIEIKEDNVIPGSTPTPMPKENEKEDKKNANCDPKICCNENECLIF